MDRFILTKFFEDNDGDGKHTVTHSFNAVYLDEVIAYVEQFLLGAGFIIDPGSLQIVNEKPATEVTK